MSGVKDIDAWRKVHMAFAEWADAWRIVPRTIVLGYGYVLWYTVKWYMNLSPYVLPGCKSETVTDCIVQAPTTQHAALVTAVVGISAAVFGLYANSGRKWNGFSEWNKPKEDPLYTEWRKAREEAEKPTD